MTWNLDENNINIIWTIMANKTIGLTKEILVKTKDRDIILKS